MPASTFSAVDFPDPFWPMSPMDDPRGTEKEASLSAQNVSVLGSAAACQALLERSAALTAKAEALGQANRANRRFHQMNSLTSRPRRR